MNRPNALIWAALLLIACNEGSFSGEGKKRQHHQPEPAKESSQSEEASYEESDAVDYDSDEPQNQAPPTQPNPPTQEASPQPQPVNNPPPQDPPPQNDAPAAPADDLNIQTVDGQEVLENCDQCLRRAQALSQTIGFTASMDKTLNLGFFKIDPAKNLCDIHFMRNLSDRIDDHSGVDSIGKSRNQVIVYCPCD